MKKQMILSVIAVAGMGLGLVSCGESNASGKGSNSGTSTSKAEIGVVTDVGLLKDGGFNEGTYNGAVDFAKKNNKTYQYYQPANGSDATDNDRVAAMELAIKNGAKVVVAPGFLQAAAMTQVASENPDIKFIFVDGFTLNDSNNKVLQNVTAITYKEQESGYMAGYAAVKDGYTTLGGCFGGGGTNPACNRYAYGYAQGINAAAKEKNIQTTLKVSYQYGSSFTGGPDLRAQMDSWYKTGTEIIFACGGTMVESVVSAAQSYPEKKIIGVDTDQKGLSDQVLTSAMKGLSVSVNRVLEQLYNDNEWDSKLGGKAQNLGAKEDSTGLPTAEWRFKTFTKEDYQTMLDGIKNGTIAIDDKTENDCNVQEFWSKDIFTNVTITLDK